MFPLSDSTPSQTVPFVTWLIIVLNVFLFVAEANMPESLLNNFIQVFGVVPSRFVSDFGTGELATIYSAMFLHGGWLHLINNMWAFFIFGDNIEDRLGHVNFLLFYFCCGTVAALGQVLMSSSSDLPMVGASGALAGVLGAYILMYPHARIITLVPLFLILPWFLEVPAAIYFGIWFIMQCFTGLGALETSRLGSEAGVAWWAHICGFLAGMIAAKIFEWHSTPADRHEDKFQHVGSPGINR